MAVWARSDGISVLDCGGKRSATPLCGEGPHAESGVAAALCHRSPNYGRLGAELRHCTWHGAEAGNPRDEELSHYPNFRVFSKAPLRS